MGYPNLPSNRIIVEGVDITKEYGLILADGYSLNPPEPRTNVVEIPGSNKFIDLTEALIGDVTYSNRTQEFTLYSIYNSEFEKLKTDISNFLHGRKKTYRLTMDPEYIYTGRFAISSYVHSVYSGGKVGVIKLNVTADPYKSKGMQTFRFNAAGGIQVTLNSGRKLVSPKFEFNSETIVAADGVYARMQPGAYRVNDLWFKHGANTLYLNSYLGDGNVPISKYASDVIKDHRDKFISDLMWSDLVSGAILGSDWEKDSIGAHAGMTIGEAEFAVDSSNERYAVYIQYDWSDL